MPGFEGRTMRREAVAEGFGAVAFVVIAVLMLGMVALIAVNAGVWFWPAEIWQVTMADGRVVLGHRVGSVAEAGGGSDGPRSRLRTEDGRLVWIDEAGSASWQRSPEVAMIMLEGGGRRLGEVAALEFPDGEIQMSPEPRVVGQEVGRADRRADRCSALEARVADLRQRLAAPAGPHEVTILSGRLHSLEAELSQVRGGSHLGRLQLRQPDGIVELRLEEVATIVWPNRMGPLRKLGHSAVNLWRFLITHPSAANTEGGVFPALFGTVTLVFLMTLAVMPLGVLCAVYMSEYARDGLLLRLATHAVNNLAGVPSIVFGMFGLAFFIYGMGGAVDRAIFDERLPAPTFGTGGILWASLTLALLTVPVVVVATREGLETVPSEWRTASRALGATQWQTLRSIVLPAAIPGMLTGLILAVSRAAGEVAPLMLTGVVKLAHSLPVDGTAPYLHLDRKFMHLGYHIWDVSMQSPNVEAAKPMAFASALVLLGFVVMVNLVAIWARSTARRRYHQDEA